MERGKPEYPEKKSLGVEKRTNNKLNPHMAPRLGIEPGPLPPCSPLLICTGYVTCSVQSRECVLTVEVRKYSYLVLFIFLNIYLCLAPLIALISILHPQQSR